MSLLSAAASDEDAERIAELVMLSLRLLSKQCIESGLMRLWQMLLLFSMTLAAPHVKWETTRWIVLVFNLLAICLAIMEIYRG